MQSSFYVSLSAQLALDKRLATIAGNVANASSVGYRASGVSFESILSRTGSTPTKFASAGTDFISRAQGDLTKTDGAFDVAVSGDGWLAIQTPTGVAYTRDGRLQVSETGELRTLLGFPVLDAGAAPIVIDPNAGPPTIFRDGTINQGGRQFGAIGLFSIADDATLTRAENSSVTPSKPAAAVLDFVRNGLVQGFVEGANVNPVHELTRLIAVQRTFEDLSAMQDLLDNAQRNAVRTLGGSA